MTPNAMDVLKRSNGPLRDMLLQAQYFSISERLYNDCFSIMRDKHKRFYEESSNEQFSFPLPSKTTVISYSQYFDILIIDNYSASIDILVIRNGSIHHIWNSENVNINHKLKIDQTESDFLAAIFQQLLMIEIILNAIAEPRLIAKRPPCRQFRKNVQRAIGAAPLPAWSFISWSVGDTTHPKQDDGSDTWRAPLHFSRAHWRRAKGTEPSARPRDGKKGLWIWVASSWKGHPDFGIKLHHYIPRAKGEAFNAARLPDRPAAGLEISDAAASCAVRAWRAQRAARGLLS